MGTTDLKSQQKTWNARYRARDPWSARTTPQMLRERERERETDIQTCRQIHVERDLDTQTD